MSMLHAGHAALHEATKHDGAKGAAYGAMGVAGTAAGGLALAGLMLTPLGWGVALATGAAVGGSGLLKKLRG
jgi:hypothetical protein